MVLAAAAGLRRKGFQMNKATTLLNAPPPYRWLHSLVWATGGIGMAMVLDSAAIAAPIMQTTQEPSIWPILVPLGTASIGVERATEVIWNYVEWVLLNSRRWNPADLKAAQYIQFKSGSSMLVGVIIGILVANYTNMRLFEYLRDFTPGFIDGVPEVWDTLITGLIIGSGAKPAHEILGIITQAKNFLGNASINQRENAGSALAEGILKLAESEKRRMVDVPGVGPSRIPMPSGSTRGMPAPAGASMPEGADEEQDAIGESEMNKYLDILRNRTAY